MLAVSQLFAATYRVRSYSFDVKGKTKNASLLEFIDSKDNEKDKTFESREGLEAFLNDKQQQLVNKRVFHQVEYTYELQETSPDFFDADVVFHIVDASTFLIVPYPKYDSNYGMSLKLKAKDSNFLGTFSTLDSTLAFTQRNNTFRDGKLEWDIAVDSMRLGDAKLSFSHSGAMDFLTWTDTFLGASVSVSEVKFWDMSVNGSFSFKFAPKGAEKDSPWGGKELYSSIGVSFLNPKMRKASATNTIKYTFSTEKFETVTTFSYLYDSQLEIKGSSSVETVQYGLQNKLDYIIVGTGASKGFTFFKKLAFTPSFWFYLKFTVPSEDFDPYPTLTLPFSFGRIDWVGDNNFRQGLIFNIKGVDEYHVLYGKDDRHKLKLTGNIQAHYPVTSWFNPSARLDFILASEMQEINKDNVYSWNMRGIRDANEIINKYRKIGMTLNLDLMFNFIKIGEFCKTYASAFSDVFVGSNSDGSFDSLVTVGAEGIVILNSHPGYPIRGSLGFNADHLVKVMKGEMDLKEMEYELYIGLYFFY